MRPTMTISLILILFLSFQTCAEAGVEKVLRVRDGRMITFDQMIEDLKGVSAVFVGEVHNIPAHHSAQLEIIRALHESGVPLAVGLEMFRAENQDKLDSWIGGQISTEQFLPIYSDNWGLSWPLYEDIFVYARRHEISLAGLNIPQSISRKIARHGFESLTAEEKKELPPGITCNVDPTYMEFIKRAYSDHSGHQGREFSNFCEAQMVWDKAMAWNLAEYLKKNHARTMVVLAGTGHAWKRGIPEQLPDSQISYRVVLPSVSNRSSSDVITAEDADYVLLTDSASAR